MSMNMSVRMPIHTYELDEADSLQPPIDLDQWAHAAVKARIGRMRMPFDELGMAGTPRQVGGQRLGLEADIEAEGRASGMARQEPE